MHWLYLLSISQQQQSKKNIDRQFFSNIVDNVRLNSNTEASEQNE